MEYTYINPLITDKHEELRLKIRKFAEEEIAPHIEQYDVKGEFASDIVAKMGDLGLFGISIPEEFGGLGLDTLSYIIIVEELSRVDGSMAATIAAHNSLGVNPIYLHASDELKEKYLPKLTKGDKLWAFGLTEPNAGSDANNSETTAVLDGDEWVINGEKIFITNSASPMSAGVTIQAVTGESNGKKELTSILVDHGTPGFTSEVIDNKLVWRSADTGRLIFKDCRVPVSNTLGRKGRGKYFMMQALDSGRLSIGAMGLGLAQGAYELAHTYSKKRKQFGKPISRFQAVAFKLSDMAMKLELGRNTLYKACWQKEQGMKFGKEAAMAKLYTSEIAREIADEAVQVFGGNGLIRVNRIERFYRDQRILQVGEGTSEILRLVISKHIGL
jgi:short/branched chain acyl-CoA dehydrogenase